MFELKTIGSDPEFFLFKDNSAFPAIRFTSGTKQVPEEIKPGFMLQKDNLLIEGNIPPCINKNEFVNNLLFLKDYIRSRVEIKNLELVCADSAKFKPRYLRIPEAQEFGCNPYRLAWNKGKTIVADDLSRISYRVAGFHIHIGYKWTAVPKRLTDIAVAKAFDLFVTNPSRKIYLDEIRKKYYGRFGSYREKSYGIECRSLGGYFLNDKYLSWIWDQIMVMSDYLQNIDKNTMDKLFHHNLQLTEKNIIDHTGIIPDSVYNYLVKKPKKVYAVI